MHEGDIIRYNLDIYGGFDIDAILKIVEVCNDDYIIVTPINGVWPEPFHLWNLTEKLNARYIMEYIYTIEPRTPPRNTE